MTHLYQLCHNARRMDRHSEAELWARFKAVRPQDACVLTPARPAPHPMPEQIDAALEWAREYLTHQPEQTMQIRDLPVDEWILRIQGDLLIISCRVEERPEGDCLLACAYKLSIHEASDKLPAVPKLKLVGFTAHSEQMIPI